MMIGLPDPQLGPLPWARVLGDASEMIIGAVTSTATNTGLVLCAFLLRLLSSASTRQVLETRDPDVASAL